VTPNEARSLLFAAGKWPTAEQAFHKAQLIEAFRVFWRTGPTANEFAACAQGLVVFPEVLWELAHKPSRVQVWWNRMKEYVNGTV
jgi:hypothetical protein